LIRPPDGISSGDGLIVLNNVHKSFGSLHAVRGVSLVVHKNEFVTLLGPSGCGKTTLLRLIGGFEQPDSGAIMVAGRLVESTPVRARQTRMVFQQYALFPNMSVQQNVDFGLRMRGIPRAAREEKVKAALDLVQLRDKMTVRPTQLSGGQQQRVALARAIITEPSVLLLDEPLAALDLQLRKAMQFELKNLQRQLGITFIYVTHDQTEALTMSDRVVVMLDGVIEQIGSGEDIYDRPASRFVAGFIGEANIFEGQIISIIDGAVIFDLDGVKLRLPPLNTISAHEGQQAQFMIRPERLLLSAANPGQPQGMNCQVIQRLYMGSLTRLILATPTGRRLVAEASHHIPFDVGESVNVHWADDSVRWLTENRS
jgi:spermidine/putrescine transport system ATP-binding protein